MARHTVWILGGATLAAGAVVVVWFTAFQTVRMAPQPGPLVPLTSQSLAPEMFAAPPQSSPPVATVTPPTADEAPLIPPPAFDVVRVARDGDALVAGTAQPGAAVTLRVDGVPVAEVAADPSGQFVAMFSLGTSDAAQMMTLEASDAEGTVSLADDTVLLTPRTTEVAQAAEVATRDAPVTVAQPVIAEAPQGDVPLADVPPLAASEAVARAETDPPLELAPVTAPPEDDHTARLAMVDPVPATPTPAAPVDAVTPVVVEAAESVSVAAGSAQGAAESLALAEAVQPADAGPVSGESPVAIPVASDAGALAADLPGEDTAAISEAAVQVATAEAAPATSPDDTAGDPGVASGTLELASLGAPAQGSAPPAPAVEPAGEQGLAPVRAVPDQSAVNVDEAASQPSGAQPSVPLAVAEIAAAAPVPPAFEPRVDATPLDAGPTAVLIQRDGGVRVLDRGPAVMDNVVVDTISYSDQGEVQIAGRAARQGTAQTEGTDLRIYLDNRPIGVARTVDGDWASDLPDVDPGVYTLRVDQVNAEGRVVSRFETPFQREAPEAVAAARAQIAGAAQNAASAAPTPTEQPVSSPVPTVAANADQPPPTSQAPAPRVAPVATAQPERSVTPVPTVSPVTPDPSPVDTTTVLATTEPAVRVEPAVAPTPVPPIPRATLITVQPGHTLWAISRERYGQGERYMVIVNANRSQIRNPDLIYPGQIFALPDR